MPHQLLLVGLGHAHLELVAAASLDQARRHLWEITAVSPRRPMVYTGMITGVLAGQHRLSDATLEPWTFAESRNVKTVDARVRSIDPSQQRVTTDNGRRLTYDFLSIAVGSTSSNQLRPESQSHERESLAGSQGEPDVVPLRPIETLFQRMSDALARKSRAGGLRVAVVGGGWAGFEVACSLCCDQSPFKESMQPPIKLVTGHHAPALRYRAARRILRRLAIEKVHQEAIELTRGGVVLDDQSLLPADLVILATGPRPPGEMDAWEMPTTEHGFIHIDRDLSVSHQGRVWAVGDVSGPWCPKNGVHALRQGRQAWDNINRVAAGNSPRCYSARWPRLQLVNVGDEGALAHWGPICVRSQWALTLKHWIDHRYVARMRAAESTPTS